MAVLYAENLTPFKSATSRERETEMKVKRTKQNGRQKIRKQRAIEISLLSNISRTPVFTKSRHFVSYFLWS